MGQAEKSYRIDQSQISGVSYSDGFVEQQIEAGWLVPDTRLQDIADAWGEIVVADLQVDSWYDNMTAYNKVVRLLNTLTEEVHHRT